MIELVKETRRQIRQAKIREPRDDQYVDVCHWSRTGWAIWNKDGACTCQPANAPVSLHHQREDQS